MRKKIGFLLILGMLFLVVAQSAQAYGLTNGINRIAYTNYETVFRADPITGEYKTNYHMGFFPMATFKVLF